MRDRRDAPRETIVAVASPPGRGVRAIVRASGPAVPAMIAALFEGACEGARARAGDRTHAHAPARPLDGRGVSVARMRIGVAGMSGGARPASLPVVASRALAGASFTGEDALEIACVASPVVVDAVVAALVESAVAGGYDARLAQPGEFAFRAHRAGRLALDEAEAIAARIAATGDAELAAADELARGRYASRAAALADEVASLLARVEAGIDFADEDDVIAVPARAVADACARLATAAGALRGSEVAARSAPRPRVVLAGAPNAGKSSLFNALVGRARVVASSERGTTRDAVVAGLALGGGLEVDLVDLAGLETAESATPGSAEEGGTVVAGPTVSATLRGTGPTTVPERVSTTAPETVPGTVSGTVSAIVPKAVSATVSETVPTTPPTTTPTTAPETVSTTTPTTRFTNAHADTSTTAGDTPNATVITTAGADPGAAAHAARAIADRMQETARAAIRAADLVVRCTPPGEAPFPIRTDAPVVEVATMADLADPAARTADSAGAPPTLATSTRTGEGLAALRAELARHLRADRALRQASLAAILPRHDAAFAAAAESLAQAGALASGARGEGLSDPELVASLLRSALDRLGEVSGAIHPDDVLGLVFSRFCIGK